jgi:hypothetical protein
MPWEPDHRCRGKGKKHIIEVHYDSEDEACEDGSIDAYLEKSDDDSDSCTEASDSDSTSEDSNDDSCIEASDACMRAKLTVRQLGEWNRSGVV